MPSSQTAREMTERAAIERALLDIARRWLARAVLPSAAALASGCVSRPAAGNDAAAPTAEQSQVARPSSEARQATDAEQMADARQPSEAERARENERALEAERLLSDATHKGVALDVKEPAPGGGKPLPCREGQPLLPVRASGLSLASAPDYLELRSLLLAGAGRSAVQEFTVIDRLGTPCSSEPCKSRLASRVSEASASICTDMCSGYSLVTRHGDQIEQWSGPAELKQLLGDIISEHDALLLVASSGYQLECGNAARSTIRKLKDGFEIYATRITNTCSPVEATRYRLHVSRDGELQERGKLVVSRGWDVCIGRLPAGLLPVAARTGGSALGDFLAHCARLEQASVLAFERMACELTAHGAPDALIAAAHTAADDERRHARQMSALAWARGGRVQPAEVTAPGTRSLEQMARENVVEGCVRETYGALLGLHQAAHARDVGLRAAMLEIAEDELRHAALSHALHAWLSRQLDGEARARLEQARQEAIAELHEACGGAQELDWQRAAGLPGPVAARALLEELGASLWLAAS